MRARIASSFSVSISQGDGIWTHAASIISGVISLSTLKTLAESAKMSRVKCDAPQAKAPQIDPRWVPVVQAAQTAGRMFGTSRQVLVPPKARGRQAAIVFALLCGNLTACAHTPQGPTHFPDPPDSLEAPLHVDATLKPGATLADVMRAHLAEAQARETAEARLKIWLAWYSKQAALWSGKGLDPR